MGTIFWYSFGFLFNAEFADLRIGLGSQKVIGQVAQCRSIVRAGDAFNEHAFLWRILGSHFFQPGESLGAGRLLRGLGWHHAFEHCLCPDRSYEPLFSLSSPARIHESHRLLAFGSDSRCRFYRRSLYGLLGFYWTASMGLLTPSPNETAFMP